MGFLIQQKKNSQNYAQSEPCLPDRPARERSNSFPDFLIKVSLRPTFQPAYLPTFRRIPGAQSPVSSHAILDRGKAILSSHPPSRARQNFRSCINAAFEVLAERRIYAAAEHTP
jgi:hypothetical protein